jgi:hypothetical protein
VRGKPVEINPERDNDAEAVAAQLLKDEKNPANAKDICSIAGFCAVKEHRRESPGDLGFDRAAVSVINSRSIGPRAHPQQISEGLMDSTAIPQPNATRMGLQFYCEYLLSEHCSAGARIPASRYMVIPFRTGMMWNLAIRFVG